MYSYSHRNVAAPAELAQPQGKRHHFEHVPVEREFIPQPSHHP